MLTKPSNDDYLKPWPNERNMSKQHIATLLGATCCQFGRVNTWANNTQHVAPHRNTVAKGTQHVAPNNVTICCVGMLRSFGRATLRYLPSGAAEQYLVSFNCPQSIRRLKAVESVFLRKTICSRTVETELNTRNCTFAIAVSRTCCLEQGRK